MFKNKSRDMIRSILPSKASHMARFEKHHANKKNRARVHQTLHQYLYEEWGDDNEDEVISRINDSDAYRRREIRMMKMERRAADKINHFVRWCESKTAHLPEDSRQEKYYYISSLVGGASDVIRSHALGHFVSKRSFNPLSYSRYSYSTYKSGVNGSGLGLFDKHAFTQALHKAYQTCPAALNKALKQQGEFGCLYWRECKEEDRCIEKYISRERQYTYQTDLGHYTRNSWYEPVDYRPGTLTSRLVDREKTRHDDRHCQNKILINSSDDVDKIINHFFFKGSNEIYYQQQYYGYHHQIHTRIISFLISQGFLEKRD